MVTVGRRAYDLMYRFGAPWEGADRIELRALVGDGRCAPETLRRPGAPAARAIDLGCGAGSVAIELAEAGFAVVGVDFSSVALGKARRQAMARYVTRLARPGARFFLYAFSARPEDLPRFSFGGPSRAFPGLVPGEVERLFEPAFRIDVIEAPSRTRHVATYLMERTASTDP